jgi:hypothetical protein
MNARITASRVLRRVIGQGESLTAALPAEIQRPGHEQNQALVKELCFGTPSTQTTQAQGPRCRVPFETGFISTDLYAQASIRHRAEYRASG